MVWGSEAVVAALGSIGGDSFLVCAVAVVAAAIMLDACVTNVSVSV